MPVIGTKEIAKVMKVNLVNLACLVRERSNEQQSDGDGKMQHPEAIWSLERISEMMKKI